MLAGHYDVIWRDLDNRRQVRPFTMRKNAILFANHLVLDCGVCWFRIVKVKSLVSRSN